MSPKSRRSQRSKAAAVAAAEEARPRPRLHAHHRIRSDPFGVEPPLTIDQHLNNYHQSLLSPSARTERFSPTRYTQERQRTPSTPSSSTAATSSNANDSNNTSSDNTSTPDKQQEEPSAIFYQHRPLTLHSNPAGQGPPFPFTLLHPPLKQDSDDQNKAAPRENDDTSEGGLLQLAHVVSTFG
ncbi:hypothetical protein BJV82DRAFT_642979 [Fennellomyces sp. T-0311]|nr:hypothetical protein BJV82DRAFT_642979 [Fennellomyces sp. T-0311]